MALAMRIMEVVQFAAVLDSAARIGLHQDNVEDEDRQKTVNVVVGLDLVSPSP